MKWTIAFERSSQKYTVYSADREVPAGQIDRDRQGQPVGYREGFWFAVRVRRVTARHIQVDYSSWTGDMAAMSERFDYVWFLGRWLKIRGSVRSIS